jgi:hypothetical protein
MIVYFHEAWITRDAMANCLGLFFVFVFSSFRHWSWVLLSVLLFVSRCLLFIIFAQSAKGHFQGRHDYDASTGTPADIALPHTILRSSTKDDVRGQHGVYIGRKTTSNGHCCVHVSSVVLLFFYTGIVTYSGL